MNKHEERESHSASKPPPHPGWFLPGIGFGLALAGLLLWMRFNDASGGGWYNSFLGAWFVFLLAVLPLTVLWFLCGVVPLFWAGKRIRIYVWVLAPPLLALLALVLHSFVEDNRIRRETEQYLTVFPPVMEVHINLSGQDLKLFEGDDSYLNMPRSGSEMSAESPQQFVSGLHSYLLESPSYANLYSTAGGTRSLQFVGERMQRLRAPPHTGSERDDASRYTVESVPLQLVQPPPELPAGVPMLNDIGESTIQWIYIHYPEHVEVAPVIGQPIKHRQVYRIHLYNEGADDIVRLQINGEEVRVGEKMARLAQLCPIFGDAGGYLRSLASDRQTQTWRLRWQTLAAPGQWQEGEVSVPAWTLDDESRFGRLRYQGVNLHRLPDDRWLARRIRDYEHTSMQATPLPEPVHCNYGIPAPSSTEVLEQEGA